MLIAGIDTATAQVSVRRGRPRGRARLHPVGAGPASTPRRSPRRSSSPAARPASTSPRSAWWRSTSGRASSRGCGSAWPSAKAMAHALNVPMIGVPSLDLLAFPVRFTSRLIVAAIDARRGELFYAFYRQVPGGIQRLSAHQVGTPDDLASELLATSEECLLVGDGARRYREVFEGLKKIEIVEEGLAHPSASSLVHAGPRQGAPRGVGEALGPPAALPAQARRRDQLGHAAVGVSGHRDRPSRHRPATGPARRRPRCAWRRCAAATCGPCCASRSAPAPPPGRWGCSSPSPVGRTASTWSPGPTVAWSATRGCCSSAPTATSPPSPSTPTTRAAGSAPGWCSGLVRQAVAQGVEAVTLEVRVSNEPALALYRRFGFAPAGVRGRYYRDPVEDALVLWVHDVHLPAVRRAAGGHRGRPVLAPGGRRPRRAHDRRPPIPTSPRRATDRDPNPHPRHRDQLRRDGGRGGGRRPRGAVVGGVEPGRPARPLRRRGARDRQPGPRRAAHPGRRPRPGRGGDRGRPRRRGRRHRRPRPHRRPAGGGQRGQDPRPGVGRAVRGGQPPRGAPLRLAARGARPRAAGRGAARVGWPHPAGPDGGPRPLRDPRVDHRRRGGGGLRQGGPLPRAWATRADRPSTAWPWRATPRPSTSRGRSSRRATTSRSRGSRRPW